ncbi:MAG TPA: hypothetical protein VH643_07940 [Gemmataceae bacterium]|jgi:hypothetical protein
MTPPSVRHFIGLDLGQPSDFTALAVLERPLAAVEDVLARRRPTYALRHLRRFPLGTPYPAVAESLALISKLQVLLQARRLQVARTLPEAAVLVKELENFRVKITAARPETFASWREGQHDDLVLAAALAAWLGEQTLPTADDLPEEPVLERYVVR